MDFIMKLPVSMAIDLIIKAIDKDIEQMIWEKWLSIYPEMEKKTIGFISYEEYKQKHFKVELDKSEDEILQDAKNILKSMSRK